MMESSGAAYSPRTTRPMQTVEPPISSYLMGSRIGPPGSLLAQQRDPLEDEPARA